jgi:DNA-binding MltR family transcriptional regulator
MNNIDKNKALKMKMFEETMPLEILPDEVKASMLEYFTFRMELTSESDRGCALLAGAHLDFMLLSLLQKKMLGDKKHFESLFGFNGPAGTFSSRMLLCYSMGLITKNTLHDIKIIKKIRNEFGHSVSIISFEEQNIKDLCGKLVHNVLDKESPRSKFLNSVSGISGQLQSEIHLCKKFEEMKELDLKERKEGFDKIMTLFQNDG